MINVNEENCIFEIRIKNCLSIHCMYDFSDKLKVPKSHSRQSKWHLIIQFGKLLSLHDCQKRPCNMSCIWSITIKSCQPLRCILMPIDKLTIFKSYSKETQLYPFIYFAKKYYKVCIINTIYFAKTCYKFCIINISRINYSKKKHSREGW